MVRAVGRLLAAQGVSGALADTRLRLHDINGNLVAENDNSAESQHDQILSSGFAPGDPIDSAIRGWLPPATTPQWCAGKTTRAASRWPRSSSCSSGALLPLVGPVAAVYDRRRVIEAARRRRS
jgi:hypothetical protein